MTSEHIKTYFKHTVANILLVLLAFLIYKASTQNLFGISFRMVFFSPCYSCTEKAIDLETGTFDIKKCKQIKCYGE